ncbi:MAG: hypothetical protein Pg6C_06470 [Treponemataceae bacterium]|nr:MAG: hypothetical protein Pg6C_06470 [Treponemataceae bacterium]
MFIHVDLDAFFSSVEQLDNPEYKGKPVIVGGLPGDSRSVVSTCSYEARKFGVHSAMPVSQAYRLCPHGIFLRVRMKRYLEKSAEVMAVFEEFSPDVLQMSVDEAFIDLFGTERLFGPPENAARMLKKTVFERTGLTVSCGLAANKYIAKIASGMQKPDGLFIVQKGDEEKFMRSLPLSKFWGVGKKTLARLNSAGFDSAADIYRAPLEVLISLFGEAGGHFLYSAVRGQAAEAFDSESKSHSLSAERTYSEDITDRFVIETALLELCQTVMFRMLRHNQRGKTVHLKIRYGDFSTVNIQETGHSDVSSVDNLFERALSLLEKKYKSGSGIRLLGVGIQNISDDSGAVQGQLFDFGEEKKQMVEQAILKLQKKDPSVSVKKARLIKKNFLLAALLGASLCAMRAQRTQAQETVTQVETESAAGLLLVPVPPLPGEAPETLFSYTADDNRIEFLAEGFWEAQFDGKSSWAFAPQKPAVSSITIPVFSQKVDLALWFMLNRSWYFEGVFADGFEKNTIAAGYTGTGAVKSARLSNRKIVFPSTYPANDISRGISGGDNQAPGFSISLSGNKWKGDAAVRYDYLLPREKIWYGSNEVSYTDIHTASWSRGKFFVLPSRESVALIDRVFVESSGGGAKDSDNRGYRELLPSEYLLIPSQSLLILAKEAVAYNTGTREQTLLRVLVTFSDGGARAAGDMGNYGRPSSGISGSGFLGEVQAFFGQTSGNIPDLENYKYEYQTAIQGNPALILQSPSGFSPFASGWKYAAYAADTQTIRVINQSTEASLQNYGAAISTDIASITANDFFDTQIIYIDVFDTDNNSDLIDPEVRFPLAGEFPEIYLLPRESFASNASGAPAIRIESHSPVSRLSISASATNVRVYKNGALDAGALYDSETGTVTLSSPAGDFDRIHVTWFEENANADFGALAAAAGFSYSPAPSLELAASLTSRWTMSPEHKFADASSPSPGFVTLALGIDWKPDSGNANSLRIKNTSGFSYETDNTTGFFRVLGMDDFAPSTAYLAEGAGFMPDGITPGLNPRPGNPPRAVILGPANQGDANFSETKDAGISGIAVELGYDFSGISGASSANPAWAAVTVNLGQASTALASAARFSIALKIPGGLSANQAVYVQFGVEADSNPGIEDAQAIPTWRIDSINPDSDTAAALNTALTGWQTITVILRDEDKSRLSRFTGLRIIVTGNGGESGTILAGPYEIINPAFGVAHDSAVIVTARQKADTASGKASLFAQGKTNYVQEVRWETTGTPNDTKITLTRYIPAVDLSQHKKVNFLIKAPQASAGDSLPVEIILDREDGGSPAFKLSLDGSQFSGNWQLVSANLVTGKIFIDGHEISGAAFFKDASVVPVRFRVIIDTAGISNGVCCFDELHLEEAAGRFTFEDRASLSYAYSGAVIALGAKKFPLVSNPALNITGFGAASVSEIERAGSVSGIFDISATVAGIKLSFDTSVSPDRVYTGAGGHSIKTTLENPLFAWLSFSEQYRYGESALMFSKENTAGFSIPGSNALSLAASAKISDSRSQSAQNITGSVKTEIPVSAARYALEGSFSAGQTVPEKKISAPEEERDDAPSYADAYMPLARKQFSVGAENARQRINELRVKQTVMIPAAQLTPHIEYAAQGQYTSGAQTLFTDTETLSFSIPFSVKRQRWTFAWTKKSGESWQSEKGGNYSRDINTTYNSIGERPWFFGTAPFYDLFSQKIFQDIGAAGTSEQSSTAQRKTSRSSQYSTLYQASWQRQFSGTAADFALPSNAALSVERDVSAAANISDVYQFKAQAGWTALNCFGASSAVQLFSWYEQDEFISSLSVTAKIPAGAADSNSMLRNTITVAFYAQGTFYVTGEDTLRAALDTTFTAPGTWSAAASAAWNRGANPAPYISLIKLFAPSYDTQYLKLKRTDTGSFAINAVPSDAAAGAEKLSPDYRFAASFNHREEILVAKYVSLFAFLGASWNYNMKLKTTLIEAPAGLGGKIVF